MRPGGVVMTASDVIPVLAARPPQLEALGLARRNLAVDFFRSPAEPDSAAPFGLDFFRDTRLNIDFRSNTVTVS